MRRDGKNKGIKKLGKRKKNGSKKRKMEIKDVIYEKESKIVKK